MLIDKKVTLEGDAAEQIAELHRYLDSLVELLNTTLVEINKRLDDLEGNND